jgi:hypothetical protein
MKTLFKTFVAAGIVLGTTLVSLNASAKPENNVTLVKEIKSFNKISVAGNVQVYLVQNVENSVKVYDNYYANNALVQEQNGELRISSFDKEPLTVVVNAREINEINASDRAQIITSGKFNTISLAINLKDQAQAQINTETLDLFANLSDNAQLNLSGSASEYNAIMGESASIKANNMKSENANVSLKTKLNQAITVRNTNLPEMLF